MSTPDLALPAPRPLGPVRPAERVELIDVLRGFSLLGILLVNFGWGIGDLLPAADRVTDKALELLVSESFYPLFSFLFGLGFAVQLLRARERGVPVAHTYLRRLLALFLIGTMHAVLIWRGDILVLYSVFGLLLIPLHRLPDRALLLTMVLLLAYNLTGDRVRGALEERLSPAAAQARELSLGLADEQGRVIEGQRMWAEQEGGVAESVAARWGVYGGNLHRYADWQRTLGNDILLLFVVGLYVGRKRFLQDAARHRRGFMITAGAGIAAATAGYLYNRFADGTLPELDVLAWMAANYGVTALYIAGIALLLTGGSRLARPLRSLAPAGRMGLTNYLTQSVVMTLLFYRYGLGLDEPGATLWVLLDLAFFFGVQVPLSRWWLSRYRYGPAEWAWRSLAYGERQPLRYDIAIPITAPPRPAVPV